MKRFIHDSSLAMVMIVLFLLFTLGLSITGYIHYNENQSEHKLPQVSIQEYLVSGEFIESLTENWESEFLQMGLLVILTSFLYQVGAAESKKPHQQEEVDKDPRNMKKNKNMPWPVKKGGIILSLYENSLSIALMSLFLISFLLHGLSGAQAFNEEQRTHGQQPIPPLQYFATSRFWFESFQNWQSEFLAVGSLTILSIYLRQKGSPQSKPVFASHNKTGS